MAVYLGINMISSKLSRTWKTLKPKTLSMWKRISVLMSPNDNFANYREVTKNLETPYIPCLEVILKDLLYHDASIPDFIQDGVWNFKKLQVIGKILDQFRRCQDTPYNFQPLKELRLLLTDIPTVTTEDLDSVANDAETPPLPMNRLIPLTLGEKSDITESDTTDDSSIGHAKTPTGLMRSNSSRPRYGSVGSEHEGKLEPDTGSNAERRSQGKLISITRNDTGNHSEKEDKST